MPSVTDVQQQSTNIHGKSTPPPSQQQQQQQNLLTLNEQNSSDGITQAILVLEKKQRNLGKRKEKLEGYENEAKSGKELNKDQKEALAKYSEVLGQIECVKELTEQLKKIQIESNKNQKRLSKQAAEEKRSQISQRLTEYAQLRYLLDHRPKTLKPEESTLLDELSRLILPTNNSSINISQSVETVLAIYQGGPSVPTIKQLTGKNPHEIRELLEHLIRDSQNQFHNENIIQEDIVENTPPVIPSTITATSTTTTTTTTNENDQLTNPNHLHDYPLQFDTRHQQVPLEQLIEDSPFFQNDSNIQQQQTFVSTIHSNEQQISNENVEQQSSEEQWQHQRSNTANQRNNQNRNIHHRPPHQSYYQQSYRGSRNQRYDGGSYSAGNGQRTFHENSNRSRPQTNNHFRGNRRGNYRGNANNYQKGSHYSGNNNEQQQIRSSVPSDQQ